jgi:hypothetical protein
LLIVPSWNASSRSLLPTKQERQLMKKIALALTLLVIALGWPSRAQLVTNANNISFWVGSGTNWSVLVLDFKDGGPKQAFAWGYRYNNPAPSGAAMLLAIDAADPNLDLVYSGNAKTNLFLTRIDYFDGNTMHSRVNGVWPADGRYWGYQVTGGTVYESTEMAEVDLDVTGPAGSAAAPTEWLIAPCGASDESFGDPGRFIAPMSWDVWVFGEFDVVPGNQIYAAAAPGLPKPPTTLQVLSNRAVLTVPTQAGLNYRLAYSGFPGGPWTNEPTAVSTTNSGLVALTNTIPQGITNRFYRVVISR